jgi:hypothetical protein
MQYHCELLIGVIFYNNIDKTYFEFSFFGDQGESDKFPASEDLPN